MISFISLIIVPMNLTYGASFSTQSGNLTMTQAKGDCCLPVLLVPMSSSENNVYMAWTNNDTGHWNVFFAKSVDGGKSLKTMIISTPNGGNTINRNTEISSSGENVYVTWWTNKTGIFMPVFRASNDNGNTFGKIIVLNSTMNTPLQK
jgi:hypothetical protein